MSRNVSLVSEFVCTVDRGLSDVISLRNTVRRTAKDKGIKTDVILDQLWRGTEIAQRTFNYIVAHMRKQKCQSKSYSGSTICLFRAVGEHGETLKCAAGVLIPPRFYRTWMEKEYLLEPDGGYDDARYRPFAYSCLTRLTKHKTSPLYADLKLTFQEEWTVLGAVGIVLHHLGYCTVTARMLQLVHDTTNDDLGNDELMKSWEHGFEVVADVLGLEYKPPKQRKNEQRNYQGSFVE